MMSSDISQFEVIVRKKLTLLEISADRLLDLMKEDNALCETVAKDLSSRLNATISDLINVHTLSVRGRICAELLRLSLPIGIDPDRQIIRPSPVFVDLARRLNSTRETVSRTVSDLHKRGILGREPGALIIESPERLMDAIEYI